MATGAVAAGAGRAHAAGPAGRRSRLAADLVEGLGGPGHDVERVGARIAFGQRSVTIVGDPVGRRRPTRG